MIKSVVSCGNDTLVQGKREKVAGKRPRAVGRSKHWCHVVSQVKTSVITVFGYGGDPVAGMEWTTRHDLTIAGLWDATLI